MTEILVRVMNIIQRIRSMQELNLFAYAVFAVLLLFGIMNCLLGYRLLRFWVMLFGFAIGALGGAFCMYYIEAADMMYYLGAMVVGGLILGIVAFMSYRMGIFILGAGTGLLLSLYILHPTTSFVFFVCILIGVGLGVLGLKFCREVIIVVTSLAGGVLTGVSAAKLLGLAEFPYGILISAVAAGLGLLIQFMMNHPEEDEEEEEVEIRRKEAKRKQAEEEYFDQLAYEEMQREEELQRQMKRRKNQQVDFSLGEEATTVEKEAVQENMRQTPTGKKAKRVLNADEAALLEEQRQMKERMAAVAAIKAEAGAASETEAAGKRRRAKRADTVVDVRVGE